MMVDQHVNNNTCSSESLKHNSSRRSTDIGSLIDVNNVTCFHNDFMYVDSFQAMTSNSASSVPNFNTLTVLDGKRSTTCLHTDSLQHVNERQRCTSIPANGVLKQNYHCDLQIDVNENERGIDKYRLYELNETDDDDDNELDDFDETRRRQPTMFFNNEHCDCEHCMPKSATVSPLLSGLPGMTKSCRRQHGCSNVTKDRNSRSTVMLVCAFFVMILLLTMSQVVMVHRKHSVQFSRSVQSSPAARFNVHQELKMIDRSIAALLQQSIPSPEQAKEALKCQVFENRIARIIRHVSEAYSQVLQTMQYTDNFLKQWLAVRDSVNVTQGNHTVNSEELESFLINFQSVLLSNGKVDSRIYSYGNTSTSENVSSLNSFPLTISAKKSLHTSINWPSLFHVNESQITPIYSIPFAKNSSLHSSREFVVPLPIFVPSQSSTNDAFLNRNVNFIDRTISNSFLPFMKLNAYLALQNDTSSMAPSNNSFSMVGFRELFLGRSIDSTSRTRAILHPCPTEPPNLVGNVSSNINDEHESLSLDLVQAWNRDVMDGGEWKPDVCVARYRVAVIIPYRDRLAHLTVLLGHLLPMLKRQQLHFRIFVVEQFGSMTFNKGRVMNAAFKEALKLFDFHCVVFHDVDLIPEDDRNMYSCPVMPRHLSVAIDEMNYRLTYTMLVGGVLNMRVDHYQQVNGYSNMYWGWGAEDDDMAYRILHVGLKIFRPPANVARYQMIKHTKRKPTSWGVRARLLRTSLKRYHLDGLNSVQYNVTFIHQEALYTHIMVDIGKPNVNP